MHIIHKHYNDKSIHNWICTFGLVRVQIRVVEGLYCNYKPSHTMRCEYKLYWCLCSIRTELYSSVASFLKHHWKYSVSSCCYAQRVQCDVTKHVAECVLWTRRKPSECIWQLKDVYTCTGMRTVYIVCCFCVYWFSCYHRSSHNLFFDNQTWKQGKTQKSLKAKTSEELIEANTLSWS